MRTDTRYSKTIGKMRWIMVLLLVVFTVGCDRDHGATTGGGTVPKVIFTIPADGDTGVPLNRKISAGFSEAMNAGSVTDPAHFTLTGPGATVVTAVTITYDAASHIALFTPAGNLAVNTTYTGRITTGARNVAGASLASDYVWTFTTGLAADVTAPLLLSTSPTNNLANVPVDVTITATFNEPMDPLTITPLTYTVTGPTGSVISAITGSVTYFGNIATFNPTNDLESGATYTVQIAASDLAGNPWLVGNVPNPWTFTTASGSVLDLGILAPFGMASYGGLTNSGATIINGDAVLNPLDTCNAVAVGTGDDYGLCGGTPPSNNPGDLVITQTHPDPVTADAVMIQLLAIWNSLSPANMPGGATLACGVIGSGGGCPGATSTLSPGVYMTGSTIGVTGDLTLDGGGDPNALFVFQAPSALTTAVGSSILLTNGTKASNVFWFVGSSATINGSTEFNGNVLASASISMGTGATSCGRLLAGAEGSGAFTFLGNTVSVPGHANAPVGCE